MSGLNSLWMVYVVCISICCCCTIVVGSIIMPNMEDNCILSFIVPKDKMKSSCELDEKVNRQINAVEMKVNIYKQQVYDLQTQLDKQRQFNSEKLEQIEKQLKTISASMDMNFLTESRLTHLEKGFRQIHLDTHPTNIIGGKMKSSPEMDKSASTVFNSIESSASIAPSTIKVMIQTEVKELFDNFTRRFETYVPEQILFYNKVFNMLPRRRDASTLNSVNLSPSGTQTAVFVDKVEVQTKLEGQHTIRNNTLMERSGKVKSKQINTDNHNTKHIGSYTSNMTSPDYVRESGQVIDENVNRKSNQNRQTSSGLTVNDELAENNESFSGENADSNDTTLDDRFTANKDPSGSASSRISQHSEAGTNSTDSEYGNSVSQKNCKGNLSSEQFYQKIAETEARLKEEITAMLYTPLAEVMSFVENQKLAFGDRIKYQEEKYEQINKELKTRVKELENNARTTTLQLHSLSLEVKDLLSKTDKITPLEERVSEIKRNITKTLVTEHEEQNKKFKKLERLMGVYQQSMEHYRNDTKHEYYEIRDWLEKDINTIRIFSSNLQNNVTTTISSEIHRLNSSYMTKFHEINEQIRAQEDALLLVQIDIANTEKVLKNNPKRSDREFEDMQETVNEITIKQRDFKKKLEQIEQNQASMHENVSNYVKDISSLKMEVKLNLDEWLPLTFEFDSSRTECFGDQYVKRIHYSKAKFVGVVLCSPIRYKIFLSTSIQNKFWNIGDGNGMGEDHCEFVGANSENQTKLSPFKPSFGAVQGYSRNQWGQDPIVSYLNVIKPSPYWYECGIRIP